MFRVGIHRLSRLYTSFQSHGVIVDLIIIPVAPYHSEKILITKGVHSPQGTMVSLAQNHLVRQGAEVTCKDSKFYVPVKVLTTPYACAEQVHDTKAQATFIRLHNVTCCFGSH